MENVSTAVELQFNIIQKIKEKNLKEGSKLSIKDVSRYTGISRPTLYRLSGNGHSTSIRNVILLCDYFQCEIGDLMEYKVVKSKL